MVELPERMYNTNMNDTISDFNQDPYAGAATEEERRAIYKELQIKYEKDLQEYEQKEQMRKKEIYNELSKAWDMQRQIQLNDEDRFHKSMLTMSAGSFGVSFAFINQIVPLDNAIHIIVLIASWVLFGLSIICAILELRISSSVQDRFLDTIEENIELGYAGKPYKNDSRWLMLPTRIINWLSFILFIGGILCLLSFVYINMTAI
jgi:hypothetical protein